MNADAQSVEDAHIAIIHLRTPFSGWRRVNEIGEAVLKVAAGKCSVVAYHRGVTVCSDWLNVRHNSTTTVCLMIPEPATISSALQYEDGTAACFMMIAVIPSHVMRVTAWLDKAIPHLLRIFPHAITDRAGKFSLQVAEGEWDILACAPLHIMATGVRWNPVARSLHMSKRMGKFTFTVPSPK